MERSSRYVQGGLLAKGGQQGGNHTNSQPLTIYLYGCFPVVEMNK